MHDPLLFVVICVLGFCFAVAVVGVADLALEEREAYQLVLSQH